MFIEPMIGFSQVSEKKNDFFKANEVSAQGKSSAFKDIFMSAVNDVKTTEDELAKAQYLFSTGQLDDPHTLTIASTKAQTSVDMLVQLRNKALETYNEIMRMNI